MPARRPEELHTLFAEAFNAGNLDGLVALYERDALLSSPEGETVTGTAGIRQAYSNLLANGGRIEMETKQAFESKDGLALLHGKWTLTGSDPNDSETRIEGRDSEVARRQPDGTWLFVIDNPFSPE